MQLIGYMDSPFVRRVAITMRVLGIDFVHRELSIFRDFDEFRALNPLVKVPTLALADGTLLVDSNLIIAYLETRIAGRSLMPGDTKAFGTALQQIGISLVAMEKVAQLIYETEQRPAELQSPAWTRRLEQQLAGAAGLMESYVSAAAGTTWLLGESLTQPDISTAVAWRFIQHNDCAPLAAADYPALAAFSARAEALPEFLACPLDG